MGKPGGTDKGGKGIFEDTFGKIPNVQKLEIIQFAKSKGEYKAAEKYYKVVGISVSGLYKRLKKELHKGKTDEPLGKSGKRIVPGLPEEPTLTRKEKKFLKDLESGKASLEEASRLVAGKVFRKMLLNPDSVQFLDFFRTELLKIKKMEAETKKTWSNQLLARMFGGGELPPPVCPSCKHVLIKGGADLLEGDILDAEPISDTEST